jgi:hypothetical protein
MLEVGKVAPENVENHTPFLRSGVMTSQTILVEQRCHVFGEVGNALSGVLIPRW